MKSIGWSIIFLALLYGVIETSYFSKLHGTAKWGMPTCPEEVIADGLCGIQAAIGFAVIAYSRRKL